MFHNQRKKKEKLKFDLDINFKSRSNNHSNDDSFNTEADNVAYKPRAINDPLSEVDN